MDVVVVGVGGAPSLLLHCGTDVVLFPADGQLPDQKFANPPPKKKQKKRKKERRRVRRVIRIPCFVIAPLPPKKKKKLGRECGW